MDNAVLQIRRDAVKSRTLELLDVLLDRDNRGTGWVCPYCGNGRGKDGDGLARTPRNQNLLICFRCGQRMDVLDIAGEVLGLSSFDEKLAACENLAGIDPRTVISRPPSPRPAQTKQQERKDYTRFFKYAHCNLHQHIATMDYLRSRGISDAVALDDRFNLGLAEFSFTGITKSVIVLPTSKSTYTVRNLDPGAGHDDRYRRIGHYAPPFNAGAMYANTDRPCFIAEGILDALSIFEAGGSAAALGSADDADLFIKAIDQKRPTVPLMLCLDDDEAGDIATVKLCNALDDRKIRYSCVSLCHPGGDINDMLRINRAGLKALVNEAERSF